jgi:ribosome modulation factor
MQESLIPRPPTKNPALRGAYDRGAVAARSGKPLSSCPYRIGSCRRRNAGTWAAVFRSYWQRGFFDAKDTEAQTGRLL